MRQLLIVSAALLATACAHAPEPMASPPDFSPIETTEAPRVEFYAGCIGQATAQRAYGRASDGDTEMVLFICTGTPAQMFYDELEAHSASVGSEVNVNGRIYRSTNPVHANLFGVDYCWNDHGDYQCTISLNAGAFLRP